MAEWGKVTALVAVVLLQFGYAGLSIVAKTALDEGMNHYTFIVYRHAVAAALLAPFAVFFERKKWPKMTLSIIGKIMLMGLLEPVIDQNLYYLGMQNTTATFASAMGNVLPAFTFIIALVLRVEKVKLSKLPSQAKVAGTILTIGGAMIMTLFNGPILDLPWTKGQKLLHSTATQTQNPIKGAVMIAVGCLCCALFMNLQANVVSSYPVQLSLTTLICLAGALEGAIVTLVAEYQNSSAWILEKGPIQSAAFYSGIVCSALAYYIQGLVMKEKGPVYVSSFNPLGMIIVAIISSFLFGEQLYLGRVLGAAIIIIGLYFVLWGKSKDEPQATQAPSNDQEMAAMEENVGGLNADVESNDSVREESRE